MPVAAHDATPDAGPSLLAETGVPEVEITGSDEGLTVPEGITTDPTLITFHNDGPEYAYVELYQVPEDMTFDELVAALEAANSGEGDMSLLYTLTIGGGIGAEPGGTGQVIVQLPAGEWLFNYYYATEEESFNAPTQVTVAEGSADAVVPEADVTVDMFEMDFTITGEIQAGPQVWEITTTGAQPHFTLISSYPEPFTEEDVMALLDAQMAMMDPSATPEAPAATPTLDFELIEDVAESGLLSTGQTNWIEVDLEPGYYVLLCFVPDAETGAPHAMLGMIEVFEVA